MSRRAQASFTFLSLIVLSRLALAQPVTNVSYVSPLLWTDRVGNTHPAKFLNIEWWDDDSFIGEGSSLQYLGTNPTDAAGNATFSTNEDDYGTNIEFFTKIRAAVQDVTHVKANIGDTDPYIVRFPGGTSYVSVAEGATASIGQPPTLDNTTNAGTAVEISQLINFTASYYKNTLGASIPFIPVIYNSSITGSVYYDNDRIELRYGAWGAIDVINHELGHHIAHNNNLDGDFSGGHTNGVNNINPANPAPGARLGYGEAVGTHLGLMAIKAGNLAAAIPGLPAQDYNNVYESYQSTGSVTKETHLASKYTLEDTSFNDGLPNVGEGDEGAVGRVLWDFFDTGADNEAYGGGRSDRVSFGAQKTWDVMHGKQTFFDLWKGVEAQILADKSLVGLTAPDSDFNVLRTAGEVLQEYAVAGAPLTTGTVNPVPRLRFAEQNSDLSQSYRWLVFNDLWNIVEDSGQLFDPSAGLSNVAWKVPNANPLIVGENYWWVILSSSAMDLGNDPGANTNWYWSGANLITVEAPEPSALGLVGLLALALRRRN